MVSVPQTKMKAHVVYECIFERNATFNFSCLENAGSETSHYHKKCRFLNKVYYIIFLIMKTYKQVKIICKIKNTYIHDQ